MLISERERIELVRKLEDAVGHQAAATLMEYLPANGWRDMATVSDLDNQRLALKMDIAGVREELKAEIGGVRGDIARLDGQVAGLRGEMRAGFDEVRGDLLLQMVQQTRTLVVAFVTALVGFGGLLVAAAAIFKP